MELPLSTQPNCRGLTLVEVLVVLGVVGIGVIALAAAQSALSEEARTAKCMSNLRRGMTAVQEFTVEHDGNLPGPVHPQIFRELNAPGSYVFDQERIKSLTWLLGPYLTPGDPSVTDPTIANKDVDELFRCPTASMISPDRDFLSSGSCWSPKAFNYVCNTWGTIAPPGSTVSSASQSPNETDPPHYFGAWFLCDSTPARSDVSWWPKRLDSIRNAGAEWALADAWYRRVPPPPPRSGTAKRQWLGTFAPMAANYLSNLPSAPYHRINIRDAKSHRAHNSTVLPDVAFAGETNQAYFDGHVAPFVGDWTSLGEGGTVNPYWATFGGNHSSSEPWYP